MLFGALHGPLWRRAAWLRSLQYIQTDQSWGSFKNEITEIDSRDSDLVFNASQPLRHISIKCSDPVVECSQAVVECSQAIVECCQTVIECCQALA